MTAIFEFPLQDETLSEDEVAKITGCARQSDQVDWLRSAGWEFHKNRAGKPIVGRMYARLRMAGIVPAAMMAPGGWQPDFSAIQ